VRVAMRRMTRKCLMEGECVRRIESFGKGVM